LQCLLIYYTCDIHICMGNGSWPTYAMHSVLPPELCMTLGDADNMRKIISLLPESKYESIIIILHNLEDLSQMTPALVIRKIVAYAFACVEKNKLKKKAPSSSSSSEEVEEYKEDDDDEVDQASTSSSKDEK
jgi:hypothetical protein